MLRIRIHVSAQATQATQATEATLQPLRPKAPGKVATETASTCRRHPAMSPSQPGTYPPVNKHFAIENGDL